MNRKRIAKRDLRRLVESMVREEVENSTRKGNTRLFTIFLTKKAGIRQYTMHPTFEKRAALWKTFLKKCLLTPTFAIQALPLISAEI